MTALKRVTDAVRFEMDAQEEFGTYQPERVARAALLAIREPAGSYAYEAKEAANVGLHHSMHITETDAENVFAAMIDAILNETPE